MLLINGTDAVGELPALPEPLSIFSQITSVETGRYMGCDVVNNAVQVMWTISQTVLTPALEQKAIVVKESPADRNLNVIHNLSELHIGLL